MRSLTLMLLPAMLLGQPATQQQLLRTAVQEQEAGKLEAAIGHYRQILKTRPGLTAVWTNLAAALAASGRLDEAIVAYQTALGQKPHDPEIHRNLGLVLYQQGNLEDAARELAVAHESSPQDTKLALIWIESLIRANHPDKALALLEGLNAGADSRVTYLRGTALVRSGQPETGALLLEDYARQTHDPDALLLAGVTYLQLAKFAEAVRDLDQVVSSNASLPGALAWAGLAHDKAGDEDEAKNLLQRAVALDSKDFDAHLNLGSILIRQREYSAAEAPVARALQLQPNSPQARYAHALLQSGEGQFNEAVSTLEGLVRLSPEWVEPHAKLASLYFRLQRDEDGRREQAIVDTLRQAAK